MSKSGEIFDPYYLWLGIAPADQPANSYRLLGIALFEENVDAIDNAADQRTAHLRTLQTGKHAQDAQKLLNEIAVARVCLLNADKKAEYDLRLKTALAKESSQKNLQEPKTRQVPRTRTAKTTQVEAAVATPTLNLQTGRPSSAAARARAKSKQNWLLPAVGCAVLMAVVGLVVWQNGSSNDQPVAKKNAGIEVTPKAPRRRPRRAAPSTPPASQTEPDQPDLPSETPSLQFPPLGNDLPTTEPEKPESEDPQPVDQPSPSIPSSSPVAKLTVPDVEALKEAQQTVAELFSEQIAAARSEQAKTVLARDLMRTADESTDDPAAGFVLLTRATELSVQSGSIPSILATTGKLDERYDVDVIEMRARAFDRASRLALDAERHVELTQEILTLAADAANADRFDTAMALKEVAQRSARRAKNRTLAKNIREHWQAIDERQNQFEAAAIYGETLKQAPDDPQANHHYGRYLCLTKGDWEAGMPLLAKSDDPKLAAAARESMASPSDIDKQVALGDEWYDLARSDKDSAGFLVQAALWYRSAHPSLKGLRKSRVESRLKEAVSLVEAMQRSSSAPQLFAGNYQVTLKPHAILTGHVSDVLSLAVSPDGTQIASGDKDGTIRLWDTITWQEQATFKQDAQAFFMVFFPNGKMLASGYESPDKIFLWDLASKSSVQLKSSYSAQAATVSPDGKALAIAMYQPFIEVFDMASGQSKILKGHTKATHSIAFSPDGRILASGSTDKTVRFWNQGGTFATLQPQIGTILHLVFSPDGKTLLIGARDYTAGGARSMQLWDVATAKIRMVGGVPMSVEGLVIGEFSPNGMLVAASHATGLRIYDSKTGELRGSAPHPKVRSQIVRGFTRDGKQLLTTSGTDVFVWDVKISAAPSTQ